MNESFYINPRRNGSVVILDIVGSVTGTWAQILADQLMALKNAGEHNIILNFQDVTSIDTLGDEAIMSGRGLGLNVKIIPCREIFNGYGFSDDIEIHFNEEEALQSFGVVYQDFSERRHSKRIPTNISGEIYYRNSTVRGVMRNVSEGGALLGYVDSVEVPAPVDPVRPSEPVQFAFRLPLMGNWEIAGDLVRFQQDSEMRYIGIRFRHNENSRHLIRRICEDPNASLPPG